MWLIISLKHNENEVIFQLENMEMSSSFLGTPASVVGLKSVFPLHVDGDRHHFDAIYFHVFQLSMQDVPRCKTFTNPYVPCSLLICYVRNSGIPNFYQFFAYWPNCWGRRNNSSIPRNLVSEDICMLWVFRQPK